MANKKILRPGITQTPTDYQAFYQQPQQPLRDPNEFRLPPALRKAAVVLAEDEPPTPDLPPVAPFPPEVRRPYNQGLYINPVPTSKQFGQQVPTISTTSGGKTTIIELGGNRETNAPSTLASPGSLSARTQQSSTVAVPPPSPNAQALTKIPPTRVSLRAGGQGQTPAPSPQLDAAPLSRVDRALTPQQPVPARPSGGMLDRVFDWVGNQADRIEQVIVGLPQAAIKYGGTVPNQSSGELIQYPAIQPKSPMSQPAQALPSAMQGATRPAAPRGNALAVAPAPTASASSPPMQRYAYNQMPAALTAPQAATSPIAPAQVLPSQANLTAAPQLSQAPAMGTQAPTESQRAMDAYAAARMAKMQPGKRMTDIDLAREQYINQGARPVLDVNQAGMPIVAKQRRGFGEILKTAGAGALQGLAAGGIGGAIGGALAGGISQAVSPEAGRRLRFEALERPGLEQARQQQIAEAQQAQQDRLAEAQIRNLETQALERAADIEFRGEEADRRGRYVTLGAGETFYERDPRTGRMVPRATNPREFADRGGSVGAEAAAQSKMTQEAYEEAQNIEKLRADVVRFGNDIVDQAKGSPEYKGAMQRYQAAVALAQQRFPGVINFKPVTDQYGNTQYDLSMTDPSRRTPLLSPEEQKAAQASKSKAAAGGKRPSSSIEPRPKSKLMSLLD